MSEKTKVIKLATSATRVLGPVASASPASSSSSAAQPAAAAAASSASPSSSAAARAAGPPANATDASSSSRSGGGSSNSSSSSNNAADTSSSGSSNSRREVWAAVARNRAAFFATGAGSGSSDTGAAQAAAAAAASSSSVGPAPGGREHWPGPFATARQLLQNRDAAKAARESESASPGAKRKSGSSASGSSASKRARGAGSTAEKGDYDDGTTEVDEVPLEGGIYPSHYAPTWQPSRALPGSSNSAAVDDATISSDDGGPSPTSSPAAKSSSSSSKGAASNAKSDGTAERSRRAMAVAGPSGVRLSIPPLSVLCMEALNGFLQHCEDLGELMPDTRRRFAESVCRSRTMDGHAFSLFAAASSDELVVPDCAGVDEATMTSSLSATSGLTRLELGQCGRGLTDRAMKAIAPKAFSNLRHLSLGGPHVLSDAVLVQALKHAPQLRHLRIAASPVIAGAFIAELPSILPELESLEIEACSRVSDDELRGMVSLADLVPVNSAAAAASSSAVAGAGAGALTSSSSSSSSAKKKTKTSSPPIAANLATNDEHSALPAAVSADELEGETVDVSGSAANEGPTSVLSDQPLDGIFKLKRLSKVTLAQLPHVTDAVMVDLFITLGPSLTSLRIDRCEKVGAPSIVALAESCPNLRSLELQNLQAVPAEPFRMLAVSQRNVRHLSLKRCLKADAAVPLLFAVNCGPSLETVDFGGLTALSDEALVALARHASGSLTSLDVSMCRGITDAGLGSVADGCPRLKRLVVWGCSQITGVFYLGHKRACMPSPYDVDPVDLAAARHRLEAKKVGLGGADGTDSASAGASSLQQQPLSDVDVEALSMAPLRIYGKAGDVVAAPDFD